MKRPTVFLCQGGKCREARDAHPEVETLTAAHGRVEQVRCQKVCDGPVVGIKVQGTLQWFERIDTPKSLAALADLLRTGTMEKPLRKRRCKKRAGKLRT